MRSGRHHKVRVALGAFALLAAEVGVLAVAGVTAAPAGAVDPFVPGTRTYTDGGFACQDASYIVPERVYAIDVIAVGQAGAGGEGAWRNGVSNDVTPGGAGGLGTKITTRVNVTPGDILGVGVAPTTMEGGRRGHTGTINAKYETAVGSGGKGGSASWVSRDGGCAPTPLVIAGGGGGGGGAGSHYDHTSGGAGGSAGDAGQAGQGDGTHPGRGGKGDEYHGNGAGGAGGYGTITTLPLFVNVPCTPGDAGDAGAGLRGGDGGSGAITNQYTDGCGRVKSAGGTPMFGYIGDNSSGGGGGGGGGYPAGGGGGGADDARMGGGGGGAGGSYAGGAYYSAEPTTEEPSVKIIPVPTLPVFGEVVVRVGDDPVVVADGEPIIDEIGDSGRVDVFIAGYPAPTVVAEDVPPGVEFDNVGNGNGRFWLNGNESAVGDHLVTLTASNMAGSVEKEYLLQVRFDTIEAIEITPESPQLWAGYFAQQLDARVRYENDYLRYATEAVTWSSSDPDVAEVAADGRLTPKLPGDVHITASIDGSSTTKEWEVVTGPANRLDITPKDSVLGLGEHRPLEAEVTYVGGYQEDVTDDVTWSTSDPAVAVISAGGMLEATGTTAGASASVFASYDGTFGSTVHASPGSVTISLDRPQSIAVTPGGQEIGPNENQQFQAIGTFPGGTTADITNKVTWTSSNTVAAVMSGATAGKAHSDLNTPGGVTTISATLNGVTGSAELRVLGGVPTSMVVTPANPTVGLGQTQQLTVTATYGDGSTFDVTEVVTFRSDRPDVAVVSSSGLVIGTGHVRDERARITAALPVDGHPDHERSTDVTLSLEHPTSIAISPASPTIAPNDDLQFTAIGTFPGGDTVDLTHFLVNWTSSNLSVGTIDNLHGSFRAGPGGGGTTTVTATSLDGAVSASTVVTREIGNPIDLIITPGSLTLGLGETRQFTAMAKYVDNSLVDVTASTLWSTNGAAANVTGSGLVTAAGTYPGDSALIGARYTSPYGGTVIAISAQVTTTFDFPTSIAITPDAPAMFVNRNQTFTATGSYPDGSTHNITSIVDWSMPANSMAHLTGSTVYTEANSPGGTFTLTASRPDGTVSDTTDITSYSQVFIASSPGGLPPTVPTIRPQATAPFTSAPFVGGGGSGSYNWAVSGTLPAGLALSATTGPSVTITGTPTATGNVQVAVQVTDANDPLSSFRYVNVNIDVGKLDQAITAFTVPATGLANQTVPVSAVAGPGSKPVVFSTTNANCHVNAAGTGIVLARGSVTCRVLANQASDSLYNAAPTQQLDITVFSTQTLWWTFSPLPTATVGKTGDAVYASVTYSEGGGGPGTPLVITVDPSTTNGACTLGGSGYGAAVTYPHAGTCVINVNKAGSGTFAPATQLQHSFTVGQVLSFTSAAPAAARVGGSYTPVVRSTDPGVTPVLSIGAATTNAACSLDGVVVRFDHVGSCAVSIDTPPSALFGPAATVTQTFTIGKGLNPITFSPPPAGAAVRYDVFNPSATAPGGPVSISVHAGTTNDACVTFDGIDFFLDHAGTCVLEATQAGNDDWNAVTATQSFVVGKGTQVLTFQNGPPAFALRGGDHAPEVWGGPTGNPVVLSVDPATTNEACSIVVDVYVLFDNVGTCVIAASQAGDADYHPAAVVKQSFDVHELHLVVFPTSDIDAGTSADAPFAVALVDETNNVYVTPAELSVPLGSSSAGAIFAATAGGSPVGSVTIPAGDWYGEFFYGDSVGGVSTLTIGDGSGGIIPFTYDVNVAVGAAAQLGFGVQPADTFDGQAIPSFGVQVQDALGNALAVEGVTVTIAPDHGAFVSGDVATTDASGLATFDAAILGAPGTYQLTASSDVSLATATPSATFTVRGVPVVDSVSPPAGNVAGGTAVYLGGSSFTGATDVRFGGTSAYYFEVQDDSTIMAIAPDHAAGIVGIEVDGPAGTSTGTAGSVFTYTAEQPATVLLGTSANPSTVGRLLHIGTAVLGGGPAPTGTVTFSAGGAVLGTAVLDAQGRAFISTSSLPIGEHQLTVQYGGDLEYAATTSDVLVQVILGHASSVSLTSATNPSIGAQAVSFTAQVTRNFFQPVPTGTVSLMDGPTVVATAPVNALGRATVVTNALATGPHALTMVYSGDAVYAGSTSPEVVQWVDPRPSAVSMTSSANPSSALTTVQFRAHVEGSFYAPIPTGTVSLMDGATVVTTAPLNGAGNATLATAALPAGTRQLTTVYSGDGVYGASTSSVLLQSVTGRVSTTSIASSLNPANALQPVTFSTKVTRNIWAPMPTGTVTLMDGATVVGTGTLNASGQAVVTTSGLTVGSHGLTMVYAGDAVYAGSVSPVLTQVINGRAATVTLTPSAGSPSPSADGDTVSFSTQVSGNFYAPRPTGTVSLLDGTTVVGTATLNAAGKATITTNALAVGWHDLTIVYAGNSIYATATSAVLAHEVTPAAPVG